MLFTKCTNRYSSYARLSEFVGATPWSSTDDSFVWTRTRRGRYHINEPYFHFYFRFMAPVHETLVSISAMTERQSYQGIAIDLARLDRALV
ncbi:MAG: hypothetical protein AAF639_07715 [Chloroflexota bacterium]